MGCSPHGGGDRCYSRRALELHRRLYREPVSSSGVCRLATCCYDGKVCSHGLAPRSVGSKAVKLAGSESNRGFDCQPPSDPDLFTLGMWQWGAPNPPRNPNPPRSFSAACTTVRSRITARTTCGPGADLPNAHAGSVHVERRVPPEVTIAAADQ